MPARPARYGMPAARHPAAPHAAATPPEVAAANTISPIAVSPTATSPPSSPAPTSARQATSPRSRIYKLNQKSAPRRPRRCRRVASRDALKSPNLQKQIDPPRISSQIPGIAQTPPGFIRSADRSLSPPRRRNRRDPRDTDWSPPDADRLHPRPDDSQADARIRRLERRGGPEAVRPSVHGPDPSRTADPSRPFRSERHPAVQPAVDQDRRLSRGLRLLPAIRASRHRPGSRQADAAGRRDRRRARRAGRRRAALSAWAPPGAAPSRITWKRWPRWSAR